MSIMPAAYARADVTYLDLHQVVNCAVQVVGSDVERWVSNVLGACATFPNLLSVVVSCCEY